MVGACSQRAQARKRLREKEDELDAADREAEAQERAAKLQRGESTQGEENNMIPRLVLEAWSLHWVNRLLSPLALSLGSRSDYQN